MKKIEGMSSLEEQTNKMVKKFRKLFKKVTKFIQNCKNIKVDEDNQNTIEALIKNRLEEKNTVNNIWESSDEDIAMKQKNQDSEEKKAEKEAKKAQK